MEFIAANWIFANQLGDLDREIPVFAVNRPGFIRHRRALTQIGSKSVLASDDGLDQSIKRNVVRYRE